MLFARIALLVAVCSRHHLPCCWNITPSSPTSKTQDEVDSPPHPSNADSDDEANNGTDNNTDDNAAMQMMDDNADDNTTTQTMDDNADNNAAMQMTDYDVDNNAAMHKTDNDADNRQNCRQ
jgi:hypothetical protein